MRACGCVTYTYLELTQRRDSHMLILLSDLILVGIHCLVLVEYILGI